MQLHKEEEEQQRKLKKEKIDYYFTFDVLFEISKFIRDVNDFLSFAQIKKSIYENLILYNNQIALNEILKRNEIILLTNKKYPNYLFQIENLLISEESEMLELLKNFKNLKCLQINSKICLITENNFTENLINLQELKISFGNLNASYLKLKNLKILHIANNSVVTDDTLKELTNLTEFSVRFCKKFTGECLQYLINLKKLKIFSSKITDKYLQNLQSLTELKLYFCTKITGECLQNMSNLTNLSIQYIEISENYLQNLNKLRRLDVVRCNTITGKCLQYLTNLEELFVDCYFIKPEYLNYLKNYKRLQLKISQENLSENSLQNFTNLTTLNINHCINYKCDFLPYLINLTELQAFGVINLKDEHLLNLKKLKILEIEECENIVGHCLLQLHHLEILNIKETNVKEKYLENLTNLYSISVNINNTLCEESNNDDDHKEKRGIMEGKFLFNNKWLNSFSVVCGTKRCGLGIKQIKEIRNLMKMGMSLVEAFEKVFKLMTV
ncbi:hypothetical protein ABK040_009654 [Willaertia magna]